MFRTHTPTGIQHRSAVTQYPEAARAVLEDEKLQLRQEGRLLTLAVRSHEEIAHEALDDKQLCRRCHEEYPGFIHAMVGKHVSVARRVLDDPELRRIENPARESALFHAILHHIDPALDMIANPQLNTLPGPGGTTLLHHALMSHAPSLGPKIQAKLQASSTQQVQQILTQPAKHAPTDLANIINNDKLTWVEECQPSFFAPLLSQASNSAVRQTIILAIERCQQDNSSREASRTETPRLSPKQSRESPRSSSRTDNFSAQDVSTSPR